MIVQTSRERDAASDPKMRPLLVRPHVAVIAIGAAFAAGWALPANPPQEWVKEDGDSESVYAKQVAVGGGEKA